MISINKDPETEALTPPPQAVITPSIPTASLQGAEPSRIRRASVQAVSSVQPLVPILSKPSIVSPAAHSAAKSGSGETSPLIYSLALLFLVSGLVFVLLPSPSCNTSLHEGGVPIGHGHLNGEKVVLSFLGPVLPQVEASVAPTNFKLPKLTVNNTAYSMIAIGSYAYHLSSLVTVHSIRKYDKERDIIIHSDGQSLPTSDIVEAMTALGARYNIVSEEDYKNFGDPLYHKCGMFYGCWLKFYVWSMTEYAMVMNVDTDYLFLQSQANAFEIFGELASSPYDVAGVPDLVVGFSHPDSSTSDVFNGGWFMGLPSKQAFDDMKKYAHGPAPWKWGEMLTLNSFPEAHGGKWHRMPVGYNTFPLLLNRGAPFYVYDGPNFGSIYGLHFAGLSKVKPGTTRDECNGYDGRRDSTECCYRWVQEEQETREFMDFLTLSRHHTRPQDIIRNTTLE